MRLSHWLSRFFSQIRHHLIPTGTIVSRRRRANRADFSRSLEVRCLLSADAVDDTAETRGNSPVHLNVLFNDTSAVGGLRITGIGTTSAGTLSVADVNNDGRYDQIVFTPSSTFTGWTSFSYTIQDASGSIDTAQVSIRVISATSVVGVGAGSGQLGIVGGVGGNGYQPNPTSGFTPIGVGNFTTTETVTDPAWNREISVGTTNVIGSGTQTLTNTVTSTSVDINNWWYVETVSFSYNLWAYSGADYNHIWGGYTQTLSVAMVLGTKTTTFDFSSTDSTFSSVVTSSPGFTYTSTGGGISTYTLHLSNVDNPGGPDSGSMSETRNDSTSYTGTGTFTYQTPGGSVSGTLSGGNSRSMTSTYMAGLSQDALGNWIGGGIASFGGGGSHSNSWSGSGSFGNATFSGTITDVSGSNGETYSYMGGGIMMPDMTWALTGFGSSSGSSSRNFAYSGSGTYSASGSGIVKNGVTSANGGSSSNSKYGVGYTLVGDDWIATYGSGSGGAGYTSYSDYSGSGTYSRVENGGTISGKLSEDGHTNAWNSSSYTSNLIGNSWVTTGTGQVGADGHSHYESSGSGSFTITQGTPGGTAWSEISGSTTEKYGSDSSYGSTEHWALGAGKWTLASGSGSATEFVSSSSKSTGTGAFSRAGTGPDDYVYQISGDITKAESSSYLTQYRSAKYSVLDGEWQTDSDNKQDSRGSRTEELSSGSGSYSRTGLRGAAITGELTEDGGSFNSQDQTTYAIWSPTGWTTTGSASDSETKHSNTSFSGSGSFSGSASGGTYSGDVNEDGGNNESTTSNRTYTYIDPSTVTPASGVPASPTGWVPVSGSGSNSGKNWVNAGYSGSGTYSASGVDSIMGVWTLDGTTEFGGEVHSSDDFSSETKMASGVWETVSGSASASGSSSGHYNQSGSGTYTYSAGLLPFVGNLTFTGDLLESGDNRFDGSWSTTSSLPSGAVIGSSSGTDDLWVTTGNASGSSSGSTSRSFIVLNGTYAYGTLTASVYRKSDYSSDFEDELGTDGKWQQTQGNWSESESAGVRADASGQGTLSSSGDVLDDQGYDIGDWNFSDTFTESAGGYIGTGRFGKASWNGTKWQVTDEGESASNGSYANYDSSGSGTYSAGAVSGSYSTTQGTHYKYDESMKYGLTSGLTGVAKQKFSEYSSDGWQESGVLSFTGTSGGYSGQANNNSTLQWNIDYSLNDKGEWSATAGSAESSGHSDYSGSYSGSGKYMELGASTYDFGNSFSRDWTSKDQFDPTAAVGPNGEDPEYWTQTNGSKSGTGAAYVAYHGSATIPYTLDNGVSGSNTANTDYDWRLSWNTQGSFTPADPSTGSKSNWNSSGTSKESLTDGASYWYAASGKTAGGNYEESGQYWNYLNGTVTGTLSNSGWSYSGTGKYGEAAAGNVDKNETSAYSSTNANGTMTGTSNITEKDNWIWGYGVDVELRLDAQAGTYSWADTGGSGMYQHKGSATQMIFASGTYTASYAEGKETATGTQKSSEESKWEAQYLETATYDPIGGVWNSIGSGSGSGSGKALSDYSASGSWGSSASGGSFDTSGNSDSKWESNWTWTDQAGSLQATLTSSGTGVADSSEKTWYNYSGSSTNVLPLSNGGTYTSIATSTGSGSTEDIFHEDTKFDRSKSWVGQAWTSTESSSRSGYTEKTDKGDSKLSWINTTIEPNHTRTDTGYSSASSYTHNKDTWDHQYSGTRTSKGDFTYTHTYAQTFESDWKNSGEYNNSWVETWSYGGMSGSGSGGGYSYTSSGSAFSSWNSSGSSKSSFSESWTFTGYSQPTTINNTGAIVIQTGGVNVQNFTNPDDTLPRSRGEAGGAAAFPVHVPTTNNAALPPRTAPPGGWESPLWEGTKAFITDLGDGAATLLDGGLEIVRMGIDVGGVLADAASTKFLGYPLGYKEISELGQAQLTWDEALENADRSAVGAVVFTVTLGMSEYVPAFHDYYETGDAEALRYRIGGDTLPLLVFNPKPTPKSLGSTARGTNAKPQSPSALPKSPNCFVAGTEVLLRSDVSTTLQHPDSRLETCVFVVAIAIAGMLRVTPQSMAGRGRRRKRRPPVSVK